MSGAVFLQVLVAASASWSTFCVGLVRGWSSPALPLMTAPNSTLTLSLEDQAWMASIPPLGALIGSLIVSIPMQYLGRRSTLIGVSIPFILGFILMGLSYHVVSLVPLYIGRALTGLMNGASLPAAQIYVSECASSRIRGLLGSLTSAFLALGILAAYVIGSFVEWQVLCFILAAFPALLTLGMLFTPDSPSWLLSKGRDEQARNALQLLRGSETDVGEEFQRMKEDVDQGKENAAQNVGFRNRFRMLSNPSVVKPFIISAALMFFQQFSGINAVIFYTVSIFRDAGSSVDRNLATIIVGIVQFLSTLLVTAMVDRYGRRVLLMVSGVISSMSLAALGLFFYLKVVMGAEEASAYGWLPLCSLIIFIIAYSLGLGPVPLLIMGEIFPTQFRNLLGSLSSSFGVACTFIVVRTFPEMSVTFGQYGAFWFYSASCVASVAFVYFFLPETKGKTLEEIGRLFISVNDPDLESADALSVKAERED